MYATAKPANSDLTGLQNATTRTYRVVRGLGGLVTLFFDLGPADVPVGGVIDLKINLPEELVAIVTVETPFTYGDNGSTGTGQCFVVEGGTQLFLRKGPGNPWSVSAQNTFLQGQIQFEAK